MSIKTIVGASLLSIALVAAPAAWAADQTTTAAPATGTASPMTGTMAPANNTMAPANNATTMAPASGTMAPAADAGKPAGGAMSPMTNANAAPASGSNSFTEGQAKARIEGSGFSDVSALKQDDKGVWRGTASKDGKSTPVALDFQGNVVGQ